MTRIDPRTTCALTSLLFGLMLAVAPLQPANAEMEPIYATEVQIQGKVVGVIRKLG